MKEKKMDNYMPDDYLQDNEDENNLINRAMNHAVKEFFKYLIKTGWEDYHPLLYLKVREVRTGDNTLGKTYIYDEITEYLENKKQEGIE